MANLKTGIQWTDATWSPTIGCTRVSAGCDHCYAFQLHDQRYRAWATDEWPDAPEQYHRPFSEVQLLDDKRLSLPLRWTKPRRIFVNSMSDLFHADVPTEFIADVFAVMAMARRHTFQVLTKRTKRMNRLVADRKFHAQVIDACWDMVHRRQIAPHLSDSAAHVWPLPNVWLGTSVENQEAAYRIDWLVKTPAVVRFLSCEPLIGPVNLWRWLGRAIEEDDPEWGIGCDETGCKNPAWYVRPGELGPIHECDLHQSSRLDWIIAGGESGPDYRPLDLNWARDLRDQCVAAEVPYFFKQVGGRTSKAGGRELDGRTWDQFPEMGGL